MFDLTWYNTLNQPFLTPPAWVFAPAWTFLYITIFAALIVYAFRKSDKNKTWGYVLFFAQMLLNLLWSPIFFYYHNIALALVVVVLMTVLVLWNIVEFYKISKIAGAILIPYLCWTIFAAYLNFGILVLN